MYVYAVRLYSVCCLLRHSFLFQPLVLLYSYCLDSVCRTSWRFEIFRHNSFPGSPDSKETTSVSHLNTSTTTEQSTPPQFVDTSLVCLSATKEVPESTEAESQLPGTKTRRSNRSLRTRRSRTPSEASYSEGEVLSDSEEDRDGTSSVGEANELVPELLGEKTNAEGQDDERAAEIIQLVHNRMRDATPVSDIDLTELEIMDEWATPATTVVTTNNKRADTDSQETTEQDPPNEVRRFILLQTFRTYLVLFNPVVR